MDLSRVHFYFLRDIWDLGKSFLVLWGLVHFSFVSWVFVCDSIGIFGGYWVYRQFALLFSLAICPLFSWQFAITVLH
jgi:hypothetical protein